MNEENRVRDRRKKRGEEKHKGKIRERRKTKGNEGKRKKRRGGGKLIMKEVRGGIKKRKRK